MVQLSDKAKLLLKIVGFILGVFVIGIIIYAVFFKTPEPKLPESAEKETATQKKQLPKTENGQQPTTVTAPAQPAKGPIISEFAQGGITRTQPLIEGGAFFGAPGAKNNGINFYDRVNSQFYKLDNNGNAISLSTKIFPGVQNVSWASAANKAIIEFPDGNNVFFDFDTQKQVTLPKNWSSFSFDSTGEKIAAKTNNPDPNSRWLIISNPDGSEARAVIEMGENSENITVTWSPDKRYFGFADTGIIQSGNLKSLYLLSEEQKNGSYDEILIEGGDFRPLWSPNSDKLIYSVYTEESDFNPTLYVITTDPGNFARSKLNLNINTWSDKCAFGSANTLYCAVPQSLERGFGLVPELAQNIPDEIIKIDMNTGVQTMIAIPEEETTVERLIVNENGGSLLLLDKNTKGVKKINLR